MRPVITRAGLVLCTLVLFGALAVTAGAERRQDVGAFDSSYFLAELRGGNFAQDQTRLQLSLGFGSFERVPGRLTFFVPDGFQLGSGAAPGTPLGSVSILTAEPFAIFSDSISVVPLGTEVLAEGKACSDREPSAAWALRLTAGKQRLEVPLYVSAPGVGDPPSAELRLDLCLARLASRPEARAPLTLSIELAFRHVFLREAGTYVWHAIAAPFGSQRRGLRPSAAYELRATLPVPQTLTLSGRYLPKEGKVRLSGSLRTRGQARGRVSIGIMQLDRVVTETGANFRDAPVGTVRTSRRGTYVMTIPSRRTSGFVAYAFPTYRRCGGSKIAPGGCVTSSVAGVESDPVTVGIP